MQARRHYNQMKKQRIKHKQVTGRIRPSMNIFLLLYSCIYLYNKVHLSLSASIFHNLCVKWYDSSFKVIQSFILFLLPPSVKPIIVKKASTTLLNLNLEKQSDKIELGIWDKWGIWFNSLFCFPLGNLITTMKWNLACGPIGPNSPSPSLKVLTYYCHSGYIW